MKTKELSSAHQKQHFNGDSDAPGHGQNQEIALRLTGDLWIYPAGHYKPVVITGTYHELDDAPSGIKLFPAGLNLDIGELRRLDGHLTRMRYDSFDVMETDLPLIIRGERRTALVALFVGHLLAACVRNA